jgi:iron complex transport system substrate-binding protein
MKKSIEITERGIKLPPHIVDDLTRREFLVGAGLVTLAPACGSGGQGGEGQGGDSGRIRTIEHARGTVEVPARPERVVALSDAIIMYPLLDLGFKPIASTRLGPFVVGENDVSGVEAVGTHTEPNLEKIAGLEPDLILGLENLHVPYYEQLSEIAPTVLFGPDLVERDLFDYHRKLADLMDRLPEYEELVAEVERRTEDLRSRLEPLASELEASAFSIGGESADQVFIYYGPGTPWSVAFDRLGLRFPASMPPSHESGEEYLSLERISDFDADVVFLLAAPGEPTEEFLEKPVVAALGAAEKGQIFTVSYVEWQYSRVGGIFSVYDDIERYLLEREIDTSGDFR